MKKWALPLCIFLLANPVCAHQASTSYLQLHSENTELSGRWDIALRDLDTAIGLDSDGDGALTWGEVRGAQARIASYALAHLSVAGDQHACLLHSDNLQIIEHSDGRYAALLLRGHCVRVPRTLQIKYTLLFDIDALHRGLLNLDFSGNRTGLFAPHQDRLEFTLTNNPLAVVVEYFRAGVLHVWTGFDHLLFLAGLFLPTVLRRQQRDWIATPALAPALRETALMASVFTLTHALTLTLSALGLIALPVRWVEAFVAATVLFAGLNNLVPMVHRGLLWLAAGFGLIHGAAIAGVLAELGLPVGNRLLALAAFNTGVEIAQLTFLAIVMPPFFFGRNARWYRRWVFVPTSTAIAAIGLMWLLQRVFTLDFTSLTVALENYFRGWLLT